MTKDPWQAAERDRYTNPIASRRFIISTIKKSRKPLQLEVLRKRLGVTAEQYDALNKRLKAMELEGQLIRSRNGAFGLVSQMNLRVGVVRGSKDGAGLCIPENGEPPMYLSHTQMSRVFDGDRVIVNPRIRIPEGDTECVITDVLQRNTQRLTGYFRRVDDTGYVEPRNRRINQRVVIQGDCSALKDKSLVEVAIIRQPERHRLPEGKVVRVFSAKDRDGVSETTIALLTHNLPTEWLPGAIDEADRIADLPQGASYSDRVDLRNLALVTIDGADSRDFDDAVYCTKLPGGGYRVIIAVADVSHYVQPGSTLDACAAERCNSVYFPREVIPMLPERLSNDLCSLNPQVDRLVMVCEIHLGRMGSRKDFMVYQAVMRSHARLTYDQINAWFDQQDATALAGLSKEVLDSLDQLYNCYKQCVVKRQKRGALGFDIPEYVFEFAGQKLPDGRHTAQDIVGIRPRHRGSAHKLIEELMVLANASVGELLAHYKVPTLYRVHGQPEATKLEQFRRFLRVSMGLELAGGASPEPGDFARLITQAADHPLAEYLFPILLRTMRQAEYSPENIGHYGLALPIYCHFTSPIRRYPDLLVHRAVKALLATSRNQQWLRRTGARTQQKMAQIYPYTAADLQSLGITCSIAEHRATEASYDVFSYLSCTFLSRMVGEVVDGKIKSITSFGLFVSIGDTNVEGLVHISNLGNEYYHFDDTSMSLVGERSGRRFGLGDRLSVQLMAVHVRKGKIDLAIHQPESITNRKKKRRRLSDSKAGR